MQQMIAESQSADFLIYCYHKSPVAVSVTVMPPLSIKPAVATVTLI